MCVCVCTEFMLRLVTRQTCGPLLCVRGGSPQLVLPSAVVRSCVKRSVDLILNTKEGAARCKGALRVSWPAVGVFPFRTHMTQNSMKMGYVEIATLPPCSLFPRSESARGHVYHFSEILQVGPWHCLCSASTHALDNVILTGLHARDRSMCEYLQRASVCRSIGNQGSICTVQSRSTWHGRGSMSEVLLVVSTVWCCRRELWAALLRGLCWQQIVRAGRQVTKRLCRPQAQHLWKRASPGAMCSPATSTSTSAATQASRSRWWSVVET